MEVELEKSNDTIIWPHKLRLSSERKGSQILSGGQGVCSDEFEQSYADRTDSRTSF